MTTLGPHPDRLRALADAGDPDAAFALWRSGRRANDPHRMALGAAALWRSGGWRGLCAAACAAAPSTAACHDVAWADPAPTPDQRWLGVSRGGWYHASEVLGAALPWWVGARALALSQGAPPLTAPPLPPCWLPPAFARTREVLTWALRDVGEQALAASMDAAAAPVAASIHAAPWLEAWLHASHHLIQRWSPFRSQRVALEGMLSQASALLVRGHQVQVAHVGLGWVYRARGAQVMALTQPHNVARMLRDSGALLEQPRQVAEYASLCTASLGIGSRLEPDLYTLDLDPADRFLVCSRGLHDALGEAQILALWTQTPDPADACARLTDAALRARDPVSVGCACFDVSCVVSG